jgi:tripartite-type tricarboxylate transporter receptor subunit TctC
VTVRGQPVCCLLLLLSIGCASQHALGAAAYPAKPVRMVIPFPPGGGTDIVGRIIGQKLTEAWPYPVVVDNRPGAGSTVGTEIVARAVADGYTIEAVSMSHSINVSLYRKLPYDPVNDFAPVILVATAPNVLVVHPSVPAKSLKELIALAAAQPGRLNFSSSGNGGVSHLSGELLRIAAGINVVHIPYKGAGPAMTALVSGEVQLMMATAPVAVTQMKANKVRALAISSSKRSSLAPELPTIAESGLPGFQTDTWYGVLAPARTPASVVSRLNADIGRALESADVRTLFEQQGAHAAGGSPQEFRAFIQSEIGKWGKAIKAAGVEPI